MKLFNVDEEGNFKEYEQKDFKEDNREEVLESWLENNPSNILDTDDLLIIGRQVTTNLGSFIDLLGVDKEGNLVVMELKRDRTPRETIAQILEYASFVENLSYDQLEEVFNKYSGEEGLILTEYHHDYFKLLEDEAVAFNKNQKLVIIGQKITKEIKQTSEFLRKKGVEILCLDFSYFKSEYGEKIIATDFVVGKDSEKIKTPESVTTTLFTEKSFFEALDQNGKTFFQRLFEFAERNNLPIHWGTKGFSMNVDLDRNHVSILRGWSQKSAFGQSISTTFGLISKKVENGDSIVKVYNEELENIFKSTGSGLKWLITADMRKDHLDKFYEVLSKIIKMIREKGLKE